MTAAELEELAGNMIEACRRPEPLDLTQFERFILAIKTYADEIHTDTKIDKLLACLMLDTVDAFTDTILHRKNRDAFLDAQAELIDVLREHLFSFKAI